MVLRHIVRQWLGSLAQEKVHQTIVQAARDSVASAVEEAERDSTEPERRKSDVGVVFALGIEAGGLEDLLSEVVTVRGPCSPSAAAWPDAAHSGGVGAGARRPPALKR